MIISRLTPTAGSRSRQERRAAAAVVGHRLLKPVGQREALVGTCIARNDSALIVAEVPRSPSAGLSTSRESGMVPE